MHTVNKIAKSKLRKKKFAKWDIPINCNPKTQVKSIKIKSTN